MVLRIQFGRSPSAASMVKAPHSSSTAIWGLAPSLSSVAREWLTRCFTETGRISLIQPTPSQGFLQGEPRSTPQHRYLGFVFLPVLSQTINAVTNIGGLSIGGGNGTNIFNVQSTSAGAPVSIYPGGGVNNVNVGSTLTNNSTIANIASQVSVVVNAGGTTNLNINDQGGVGVPHRDRFIMSPTTAFRGAESLA